MFKRFLKITASLVGLAILGGLAFLWIAPPDLLRVGTNYSAKIVCSNVFLAGRDAEEVLAVDVQAPGHPLLKFVSVSVDNEAQAVEARLFRFFAPATSVHRAGLGCTNSQTGRLSEARLEAPAGPGGGLWPEGNEVSPSQDPEVQAALSDPALLGEGYRAVVAVKGGRIIGETYAEGFSAETPLLGWSMTKTVTAGLIGTLIKSGQMSLQDDLTASFPEWAADERAAITVEDMLAMASGLRWNEGYGSVSDVTRMLYLENDMAGFAASQPAEAAPQEVFTYSSGTSTMLARLWQDVVGDGSLSYPKEALFLPLGMASAVMETDARDTFVGSSYMYATARDWARYGQFLLQGGRWNGEALLPEGFTDWMFEPVPASNGLYAKGHLWLEASGDAPPFEDAVWLSGHDGQSIGIFPSHDLVVVRLGLTPSRLGYSALPLARALIAATAD
ncbi:6-aminohexanoate-dimer hydrolase [Pseudoruegeria aquimaris]|uniref:6-aminohexanoate-dimer hydrolase n=1 Tax=Pseudoruegeria aquimaris TaxID=393663 RepID=A0A1Y5TD99_9RHOB|nr:serine hydrolase [Pseudoruegeria aquimaris]SLN61149.1 6-aminohexanoate-dimer hydrolase [Pseudoruegeria aquimaris]